MNFHCYVREIGDLQDLLETVLRARYGNLYALLRDHVSEEWFREMKGASLFWMASV